MPSSLSAVKRDRVLSFARRSIASLRWSSAPVDHYDDYIDVFRSQEGGTAMPPTPGVARYTIRACYDPEERVLDYECDYQFSPGFFDFIRVVLEKQPEQLVHRSRIAAVAYGPLREAEMDRKTAAREKYADEIASLVMPEEVAARVLHICVDETVKHWRVDLDYISRYIDEHETSSIGGGYHWSDLRLLEERDWLEISQLCLSIVEGLIGNIYGKRLQTVMNVGARARSVELPNKVSTHLTATVDRTRIIMFTFGLQCWSAFIPDKVSWYASILLRTMRVFGVQPELVSTPLIHGGKVYPFASKLFQQGYVLHAYDGKQWESVVGLILGKPFLPLMMHSKGAMLGSGIAWTSLLGTIAALWVYSLLFKGLHAIILGDDINVFSKSTRRPYPGKGVVEYQELDSKLKFILGVSFYRDILRPRLQGIKLTVDNGAKARHIDVGEGGMGTDLRIEGKHSLESRLLWYGMHFGYFGARSLLEAIEDIRPDQWRGPGEMLQELAYTRAGVSVKDYPWIEEYGLWSCVA